jgi:nucleotide-binding universal stress UspA family protein
MFRTIIWATDGSRGAERALATALELVRDEDSKLLVVHADARVRGRAGNVPVFADEPDIVSALETKVEELVGLGCNAELVVAHGARDPGDLIADIAQDRGADVIVVGTRGHGRVAGMLLGSVTQRLLHTAPCPVLAVPPQVAVPVTT